MSNNKYICKVDGAEFSSLSLLHTYLRQLKIKQEDYYHKYYPKYDLYDKTPIVYKNYTDYFKSDFNNKNNLKKWCLENPEQGVEWGKKYLKQRKEEKGNTANFHHVELRTLFCPSVKFFEKYDDYMDICKELGFEKIFDYKSELKFNDITNIEKVICDTREQKPLKLKNIKITKLDYGDYALADSKKNNVFIERKSLNDFLGTLSKGYDRFTREIERAKVNNDYIVVMVEEDFNRVSSLQYNYKAKYSKVTAEFIFNKMRSLLHRYDNLQFLFVKDRKEAERVIYRLFGLGDNIRNVDLQYFYEIKKI